MEDSPHSAKRARLGERTMLACTGCKQKKLKCDGQSPKCQNCIRSARECLVEDPSTGLQRPRNYMQSLETRVAYLESLLQQARPDVANDHLLDETSPLTYLAFEPLDPMQQANDDIDPETLRLGSIETEDQLDDLSTEVAMLCISAAGREPHYFGPSSAVSFSRIVSSTMGLPKRKGVSVSNRTNGPDERSVTGNSILRLPARHLAKLLSDAYFTNIHPQYPFLHEPTFQVWEETCMSADKNGELGTCGDLELFFVFMVYAIGSLALGPGHFDAAEAYYAMAMVHQDTVLEMDSLESIQSILCGAVYSIRSPVGVSLWKLSGMAIRHCVELGYHRSIAVRRYTNSITAEVSKRCFWVAYDIDRVVAFILGRPVGIPDSAIDAELPLNVRDEEITSGDPRTPNGVAGSAIDPSTTMTGFIHAIKLRRLWSKIIDTVYHHTRPSAGSRTIPAETICALREEIDQWHGSTPYFMDISSPQPLSVFASREWFQLAYDHTILILNRPFLSAPLQEDGVEQAIEECCRRAKEVCLLYRRLYQNPTIQFTWGSLHILFLAGLTFLYCIWRSPRTMRTVGLRDLMNTTMACNTVLVIIAERWSQATAYRDLFERLSERTINLICGEGFPSGAAALSTGAIQEAGSRAPPDKQAHNGGHDGLDAFDFGFLDLEGMPLEVTHQSEWLVDGMLQDMRNFAPRAATNQDGETVQPGMLSSSNSQH